MDVARAYNSALNYTSDPDVLSVPPCYAPPVANVSFDDALFRAHHPPTAVLNYALTLRMLVACRAWLITGGGYDELFDPVTCKFAPSYAATPAYAVWSPPSVTKSLLCLGMPRINRSAVMYWETFASEAALVIVVPSSKLLPHLSCPYTLLL